MYPINYYCDNLDIGLSVMCVKIPVVYTVLAFLIAYAAYKNISHWDRTKSINSLYFNALLLLLVIAGGCRTLLLYNYCRVIYKIVMEIKRYYVLNEVETSILDEVDSAEDEFNTSNNTEVETDVGNNTEVVVTDIHTITDTTDTDTTTNSSMLHSTGESISITNLIGICDDLNPNKLDRLTHRRKGVYSSTNKFITTYSDDCDYSD